MKFIHSADLFAAKPSWRIKGRTKGSSSVGKLFTILIIALFIWACWYYSYDMINRSNPMLTQAVFHGSTFDTTLELDSNEFPFAFGTLDVNSKTFYSDPSLFKIEVGVVDDDENTQYLDHVLCKPESLSLSRVFKGLKGETSCFKSDSNLKILGMTSNVFIKVVPCQNISSTVCQSPTNISLALQSTALYFFYKVSSIQIDKFNNFITEQWDFDTYSILSGFQKKINSYLMAIQIDTDSGWMGSNINSEVFLSLDRTEIDLSEKESDGSVLTLRLLNSGTLYYYERTYKKFEDFLAQIFSVMNVIILLCGVFTLPYAKMKMYDHVAREVFRIEQDSKKAYRKKSEFFQKTNFDLEAANPVEKNISIEDTSGVIPSTQSKLRLDFSLITDENGDDKLYSHEPYYLKNKRNTVGTREDAFAIGEKIVENYINEIELLKKNKDTSNSLSFWEYITSYCKSNPKIEMIKRTQDLLQGRIDMTSIIKKCMEVDMLKHLLLNRDQKIIFENLDRPAIYFSSNQLKSKSSKGITRVRLDNWISSNDTKSVKSAYQSIKNKENKTEIDMKLLAKIEEQAYENKK